MRHLKTILAVLGAVTILVLAGNTIAVATTGHSFILGNSNTANKVTTLTRTTAGTALKVSTKSTSNAPLQVNGRGKVANLNADLVDGLDSSVLRNHSYVFTKNVTSSVPGFNVEVPVPVGTYQFSFSAFLEGGANTWDYCQIRHVHNSATTFVAIAQINAGSQTPGLSGAGT